MPPTKSKSHVIHSPKVHSIQTIVSRYQKFLNQFGQNETGDLLTLMESLFTPDIKKFVKSGLVAETREGLHAHILEAKKDTGTWTVREKGSRIIDHENKRVMACFEMPTEKKGTIVVMKQFKCDDYGLIKEIEEKFTTIEKENRD